MPNAYATLPLLKNFSVLDILGQSSDPELLRLLEASSRFVDGYCGRHFFARRQTHVRHSVTPRPSWVVPELAQVEGVRIRTSRFGDWHPPDAFDAGPPSRNPNVIGGGPLVHHRRRTPRLRHRGHRSLGLWLCRPPHHHAHAPIDRERRPGVLPPHPQGNRRWKHHRRPTPPIHRRGDGANLCPRRPHWSQHQHPDPRPRRQRHHPRRHPPRSATSPTSSATPEDIVDAVIMQASQRFRPPFHAHRFRSHHRPSAHLAPLSQGGCLMPLIMGTIAVTAVKAQLYAEAREILTHIHFRCRAEVQHHRPCTSPTTPPSRPPTRPVSAIPSTLKSTSPKSGQWHCPTFGSSHPPPRPAPTTPTSTTGQWPADGSARRSHQRRLFQQPRSPLLRVMVGAGRRTHRHGRLSPRLHHPPVDRGHRRRSRRPVRLPTSQQARPAHQHRPRPRRHRQVLLPRRQGHQQQRR